MRTPLLSVLFVVSVLASVSVTGCDCTEMGCSSGIRVEVAGFDSAFAGVLPVTVQVCVGADCDERIIGPDSGVNPLGYFATFKEAAVEGDATVTVTVRNAKGDVLYGDTQEVSTEGNHINGAMCPAACWTGVAEFTAKPM